MSRRTFFDSNKAGDVLVQIPLINNLTAIGDPGVSNDNTQGYEPGSMWIHGSSIFICTSAATGAAVWQLQQSELTANATSQSQPSAPTAPSSTSTYAMQGLAGAITPTKSGKVLVTISGNIIGSTVTAGDGIDYQLSYGTGAAPANAAPLAGTQVGAVQGNRNANTSIAADVLVPFSTQAVIALTVGTPYWLDLAAKSIGTASAQGLTNVSISAIEL